MTSLNFTKMQAAGNDFIVIDNRRASLPKPQIIAQTPELCDRHFGVGADGLIALQPAETDAADYTMFYRNADGSDAGMCGNGARCIALFASQNGFAPQHTFNVHDQLYQADITRNGQIEISFPMHVKITNIEVNGTPMLQLNTGTQHVVMEVPDQVLKDRKQLVSRGQKLRNDSAFEPTGTNVNFIRGDASHTLFLRTYEKGVEDLTLACGTGAIASALGWHNIQNITDQNSHSMTVETDGGPLQIGFTFDAATQCYSNITLSGEAETVFEGRFEI